jgi:hypothetical protein
MSGNTTYTICVLSTRFVLSVMGIDSFYVLSFPHGPVSCAVSIHIMTSCLNILIHISPKVGNTVQRNLTRSFVLVYAFQIYHNLYIVPLKIILLWSELATLVFT